MKRSIYLLFLIFTACVPVPSFSTSTPTPRLTSTPVPSATPSPSPTPDAMLSVIDFLQTEGINVGHDVNSNRGYWLIVNGEEVPNAFFDEDGKFLHIQNGEDEIKTAAGDADDRLQINADGNLLLNDGKDVYIGMFNPQNPEVGWMFFDYKAVNPAEINVEQLDGVSEIELVVDAEGNVHLPESLIAFENANAQPFPAEAFFYDYNYLDSPGAQWFDLFGPRGSAAGVLDDKGEFARNPELRPVKTEFIFKLNAEAVSLLGVQQGELFIVGCKFMNDPEAVANGAKPFGIMNMVIPGPALRELVEIGYFDKGGGFLMPGVAAEILFDEEFKGPFKPLLNGGLFNKQGLKQSDIEEMLLDAAVRNVIDEKIQRVALLGLYHFVVWRGGPWFDLGDQ